MSYTIDVVAEEPSRLDWPALEGARDERRLRVVEAEEVDLAEPWPPDLYVHAYLDGVSTRTVELNRTDTGLSVRVMTASCHEDVRLALALARAALDRGGGTAGGEDGLDLDALDDDWVSGYVDSGVLSVCAMAAREEQPLRIPGPLRTTSIGRRVIDELSAMPEEERVAGFIEVLRRVQWFEDESTFEASPLQIAGTTPETPAMVWGPDVRMYFPGYDHLLLERGGGGPPMVVRVADVPEFAPSARFLDERAFVIDAIPADEWPALLERAAVFEDGGYLPSLPASPPP